MQSINDWISKQNRKLSLFKMGRVSRLEFLRNHEISIILPLCLLLGGISLQYRAGGATNNIMISIISMTVYSGALLIGIFATIQRLHDLGKSEWYALLFFIPLVNIFFILILLFKKGELKDNQYGSAPKGVCRRWIPIGAMVILFLIWITIMISVLVGNFPETT